MSGVWNLNGHPDGPPLNCQVLVGDHGTAAHAANAALCALVERGRTGKGQFIEVGMLEVLSSMLNTLVPDYDVNGEIPRALRPAAVRPLRRLVQGQGRLFHRRAGHAEDVEGPLQPDGASGMGAIRASAAGRAISPIRSFASRSTRPSRNGRRSARRRRRSSPSRSSAFQAAWSAPSSASSRRRAASPNSRVLTKVKLPNNPKPVTVPGRSFRFPDETTEIKSAPALNETPSRSWPNWACRPASSTGWCRRACWRGRPRSDNSVAAAASWSASGCHHLEAVRGPREGRVLPAGKACGFRPSAGSGPAP